MCNFNLVRLCKKKREIKHVLQAKKKETNKEKKRYSTVKDLGGSNIVLDEHCNRIDKWMKIDTEIR